MASRSGVSVIVPARNAARTLAFCLNSIFALDSSTKPDEVIVVDDGSSDRTAEIAGECGVAIVRSKFKNRAGTRNLGARAARGEILAFVDADCTVAPDWLSHLLTGLRGPLVAAAQSDIVPTGGNSDSLFERYRRGIYHSLRNTSHPGMPTVSAAGAVYRKRCFDAVGGFDPKFSDYEDMDLAWRLLSAGYGLSFVPSAKLNTVFEPATILAYSRRQFEKGRAARALFQKWAGAFGTTEREMFDRCENASWMPVADVGAAARAGHFEFFLNYPFVASFRAGFRSAGSTSDFSRVKQAGADPAPLHFEGRRYRLASDWRVTFAGDCTLLVNIARFEAIRCDGFSGRFWEVGFENLPSVATAVKKLAREFDVSRRRLNEEVRNYLEILRAKNILVLA